MTPPNESPEVEDFDKTMYLEIMKEDPPMKRYVSRGDMPDDVDIEGPHEEADAAIFRAIRFTIRDNTPRFQPILGAAGMGKTHLYWALKDREREFPEGSFLTVYVPSPAAPVRVPLHFHACIVDETGEDLFEQAVDMLIEKYGGVRGASHEIYDFEYAMDRLLVEYPGISSDVVKVLLRFRLDPAHKDISKRWLFGDAISDDDIDQLGVRSILEEDDVTMATLKLLLEGSRKPIVLFIDEMEGPYNTHGEEGERHFLEVIKRLYNEARNVVVVASSLTSIWDRIYSMADGPTRSRMETPVHLRHFTREDLEEFVEESMKKYWIDKNVDPPPDLLYPLSTEEIDTAYEKSEGVPREAIKQVIPLIDSKLFGEEAAEPEEQADYVILLTATVVIGAISKALLLAGKTKGVETQLHVAKGGVKKQATAIIKLVKGEEERLVSIDVSNVKDWNRSGGVAAYYSVKRLNDILEAKEAQAAMVAVPEGTQGAKFVSLSEIMGDKLHVLKLTEETAKALVDSTHHGRLADELSKFFEDFIESQF
jgi:hypothetical protein